MYVVRELALASHYFLLLLRMAVKAPDAQKAVAKKNADLSHDPCHTTKGRRAHESKVGVGHGEQDV